MTRSPTFTAICVALVLALAPAARAQSAAPMLGLVVDDSCTETPSSLARDQQVVEDALAGIQRGYAGLARRLGALRTVAEHAPACFPQIARSGDAIVVRSSDPQEGMTLSLALSSLSAQERGSGAVSIVQNTYPLAFLLLASMDVEERRFDQALTWLDRGLALQPNEQHLLFEKVAALQGLQRFQEAAVILQGMIDNPALGLTLNEGRAYRNLGVVLIDLGRLDEAERALNESIRIEPNNPSARSELQYIAELRRGGAQRALELTSPAGQNPSQ